MPCTGGNNAGAKTWANNDDTIHEGNGPALILDHGAGVRQPIVWHAPDDCHDSCSTGPALPLQPAA